LTSNVKLADRKGRAMLGIRTALLLVAYLLLTACVISPLSRTNGESSNAVTLKGYTLSPGQAITIQAVDQNTGNPDTRGTGELRHVLQDTLRDELHALSLVFRRRRAAGQLLVAAVDRRRPGNEPRAP
jgi:hypothetical protein